MKKFLFSLLFLPVFSHAEVIKGTIPVMCTGVEEFAETMADFQELPLLTGVSSRDFGDGNMIPLSLVIFANGKSGTFTIVEKLEDKVCVISIGEKLQPYRESLKENYQKSGM